MVLKGKIRQDASRPELLQPVSRGPPHDKFSGFLMLVTGFKMSEIAVSFYRGV